MISDFKSSPMSIFGVNGGITSTDASLASLTGVKFRSDDDREFTLVQNGAVALPAGVLVQSPASIGANHTGLTVNTAAIGSNQITVTLGATGVTANQYSSGFVVISAGTGAGQTFKIASHPAANASATVVLTLEDTLSVATAVADSKASLTLNQYGNGYGTDVTTNGVIINPVTATGRPIGVTIVPIPASTPTVPTYGWIQTAGPVACLNTGGTAIGLDLMPSAATAGAVATYVAATRGRIGTATVAGESTKSQLIDLQL